MRLNKKTAAALTGIDWALAATAEQPQQPDEFTANEFHAASQKTQTPLTSDSARFRLLRMAKAGQLVTRKIVIGGKRTNLYRRP